MCLSLFKLSQNRFQKRRSLPVHDQQARAGLTVGAVTAINPASPAGQEMSSS